jgi:hypothetical protein
MLYIGHSKVQEESGMAKALAHQEWDNKKSDVVENMKSKSGFEGEEKKLGESIAVVLRMLGNHAGYDHEVNDPLVKAHLMAIDFARLKGTMDDYVAHDVAMMAPINDRVRNIIEKTGKKEIAMAGLFDRTACHYALALDTTGEPGMRTWKSPFKTVLNACRNIGQFPDLTEEFIHENWTKPRLTGYGKAMGVELEISDLADDGTIVCKLID